VRIVQHSLGALDAEEKTYVPEMEWPKVIRTARIWLVLHLLPWALVLYTGSILPALLFGVLPSMYGSWFFMFVGMTQHGGLAENTHDHRLNARTIYMNPVFRFLYWNMNYHVEHHMFPMVPYHALPKLHKIVQHDLPPPYTSTWQAYRELVPAVIRQMRDPEYFVQRPLPPTARPFKPEFHGDVVMAPAE
jgi:fatty acid desaturase